MNPHTRLFRRIAMLAVIGVGLGACKDTVLNIPPADPTISAAPAQLNLNPGQTQLIVATVTGLANTAVTFSSSNNAVATVNATSGLVTAVAPGAATITVASAAQPTLQTAVGVNVAAIVLPPTDSARVVIESITQSQTISPVDPDSVTGVIDITMAVERGNATELRVLVNGAVVPACSQTFGTSGAITASDLSIGAVVQSVVCSLDTRNFTRGTGADANRGIPTYPNGPLTVRVELRRGGVVLDAAQRSGFTLANSDFIHTFVSTNVMGASTAIKPSVIGDTGLRWFGNGDLQFLLVPVIYSGAGATAGSYPGRVVISFDGHVAGVEVTKMKEVLTQTAGGFVVEFSGSVATVDGVANFNTGREGTLLHVNSVTNAGQPGPATAYSMMTGDPLPSNRVNFSDLQSGTALLNSILRFDNEAPQVGRLILERHPGVLRVWARNGWVNSAVNFYNGKDGQHDAPFFDGGGAVGPRGTSISPAFPALSALPGNVVHGVGLPAVAGDAVTLFARRLAGPTAASFTAATVISGGFQLTNAPIGNALTETLTNNEYQVAARVVDRLGNSSDILLTRADALTGAAAGTTQTGDLNRIGVDNQGAGIVITDSIGGPFQIPYNPVDLLTVMFSDTSAAPMTSGPSGIALTRVQLVTYSCPAGTASGRQCAPAGESTEGGTVGTVPGSGLNWETHAIGSFVGFFTRDLSLVTVNAYHRFDGRVWDRAGNLTGPHASSIFIRDADPSLLPGIDPIDPLVSNVALPTVSQFVGGTLYSFSARVTDNVDLRRATAGFDFDSGMRLPFEIIPLTVWGPSAIVLDSLLTQQMPYIRTLAQMAGPNTHTALERPTFARFRAWDHSSPLGARSTQANNIVANTRDLGSPNWFQGTGGPIHSAVWEADGRWAVRGQTGTFTNPFVRVLFYAQLDNVLEDGLRINYLLGPSASIAVQDTGAQPDGRIWRFTPPAIPIQLAQAWQNYTLFAVGITASGDALMSQLGPMGGGPPP